MGSESLLEVLLGGKCDATLPETFRADSKKPICGLEPLPAHRPQAEMRQGLHCSYTLTLGGFTGLTLALFLQSLDISNANCLLGFVGSLLVNGQGALSMRPVGTVF